MLKLQLPLRRSYLHLKLVYCIYRFSAHKIISFSKLQPEVYSSNILQISQISASIFLSNIFLKRKKGVHEMSNFNMNLDIKE